MEDEIHRSWGRRVKQAREDLQLSQLQLGAICQIDPGTVSRIERGLIEPRDSVKILLAGALGKTLEDLFPWPAVRPPYPASAEAVGQ